MTTRSEEIKEDLQCYGVDPFQIAAEAIDRGDRLALQVTRLEKVINQIKPDLTKASQHCSGLCQL